MSRRTAYRPPGRTTASAFRTSCSTRPAGHPVTPATLSPMFFHIARTLPGNPAPHHRQLRVAPGFRLVNADLAASYKAAPRPRLHPSSYLNERPTAVVRDEAVNGPRHLAANRLAAPRGLRLPCRSATDNATRSFSAPGISATKNCVVGPCNLLPPFIQKGSTASRRACPAGRCHQRVVRSSPDRHSCLRPRLGRFAARRTDRSEFPEPETLVLSR